MTRIEILPDLEIGFPGRSDDFREGVAIGVLAALLAGSPHEHEAVLPAAARDQATELADAMGYRTVGAILDGETIRLRFLRRGLRPALRLVAGRDGA